MSRVLVLLCLLAGVAHAAPDAKIVKAAQKRFERANALYNEGKYQEALQNYQAAYDLVPSPDILFNRALAKEKTLDYLGCALDFAQYVADGGVDVEDARTRADACQARVRVELTITTVPPGVSVSQLVAGEAQFLGRTPATVVVQPGPLEVSLELEGYLGFQRRIDVPLAPTSSFDVTLEKLSRLRIDAAGVAGAMVTIDDGPQEPAPISREVRAGSYRVHVTAPGHLDDDRIVDIEVGSDAALSIALREEPTRQRLRVRSLAPSEILIDGEAQGDGELPAGVHVVEATAAGRVAFRGRVVLPAGKDVDAVITMPRRRTRLQKVLLWSGAATTGIFAIAGGIYGGLALDAEAEYADMPSRALRDNGLAFRFAADVMVTTALVAGATTVASWWLTRPGKASLEVQR